MFEKGNKLGRGRPPISLSKPELLLPAIFAKANVNWAADFVRLYKALKEPGHIPTTDEKSLMAFYDKFMPFLCTKVQLKEFMSTGGQTPAGSVENAKQTSALLRALEAENGSRPSA